MDPILLILAVVAAFVIFRLISVMGTRTGHEQRHDIDALQRAANGAANDEHAERAPPETDSEDAKVLEPVSANAAPLREADPDFDEKTFLQGARGAYEMIVEAFASGDLRSIRPFLSDSVYDAFKSAVAIREENGHVSDLKFVGIDKASILRSGVDDGTVTATTEFVSNQVRVTRDKQGEVVDGDPNRIDLVKDLWTFSRKLTSRDPNWILVATGGAD